MSDSAYVTLGITSAATPAEIKRAYRELAQKWHPDRNLAPNATEKFKQIREAYDLLKAPKSSPKPPKTEPTWTPIQVYDVELSFEDTFSKRQVNVPGTPFVVEVPHGVFDGQRARLRGTIPSDYGQTADLNVVFRLSDPTGFYKLDPATGNLTCSVSITIAEVLIGRWCSIKSVDGLADIQFQVPMDVGKAGVRLPERGLKTASGARTSIVVHPNVSFVTLEREIYPTLVELHKKTERLLAEFKLKVDGGDADDRVKGVW